MLQVIFVAVCTLGILIATYALWRHIYLQVKR